jgi:hypothetical protein
LLLVYLGEPILLFNDVENDHCVQGFRERLLADPKFLNRLAIEEGISITTAVIAQYEKRKGRFFEEIDYVLTDTIRGSVVDFFTVWLPAPTISLLSISDDGAGESLELVRGLLGSLPDNAFQKGIVGQNWDINQRVASVLMGGLKLAGVGYVSSIGAEVASDVLYAARRVLRPSATIEPERARVPIWKSAAVYSGFLGTSANLRYQVLPHDVSLVSNEGPGIQTCICDEVLNFSFPKNCSQVIVVDYDSLFCLSELHIYGHVKISNN